MRVNIRHIRANWFYKLAILLSIEKSDQKGQKNEKLDENLFKYFDNAGTYANGKSPADFRGKNHSG
jgi:hypothetical protein